MSVRKSASWAWHHIAHEWRAVLFVTSVVTIFNIQFNWLKAIDSYAFVAIGNLSSIQAASAGAKPLAAVVLIDQPTHEALYKERSPLDRCVLREHLRAIYDARPDAVAIDIDLSPALWLKSVAQDERADGADGANAANAADDDQAVCEAEIRQLIIDHATSAGGAEGGTVTVLMKPFPASDPKLKLQTDRDAWVRDLEEAGRGNVAFADPELPVAYGLTLAQPDSPQSFSELLSGLMGETRNRSRFIDPRKYRTGLKLLPTSLSPGRMQLQRDLDSALSLTAGNHPDSKRIVFFGAAYGGGDDIFLTPLGEVYGVEAHAAAYVSDEIDEHHLLDFLLDLVIALSFGLVIAWCWTRYFAARWSIDVARRERAPLWVIGLVSAIVLMTFTYGVISYLALAAGIWLSPIPIAIGMLIDSFVSGSVDEATQAHVRHVKRAGRLRVRLRKYLAELRELRKLRKAADSGAQPRPAPTGVAVARQRPEVSTLPRWLGGEVVGYLGAGKPAAAGLALVWMLAWFGSVCFALWLAVFGSH